MKKDIEIEEKKIFTESQSQLEEKYHLVYLSGYDDVIPAELIDRCIKKKSNDALFEEDWYCDARRASAAWHACQLPALKKLNEDELDLFKTSDEWQDLLMLIEERDYSNPEKDAAGQTRYNARVVLLSNYDCWVPAYDAGGVRAMEDALGDTMRFLSLNPAKVKRTIGDSLNCIGHWPDYKNREGKEVIDYQDFADVLINACGYGLWSFFGRLDIPMMMERQFKPDDLIIPKGTECTMYNWWNGSGSLAFAKTIRDVSFKELKKRSKNKYTRPELQGDEIYGDFGYPAKDVYSCDFKEPLFISTGTNTGRR